MTHKMGRFLFLVTRFFHQLSNEQISLVKGNCGVTPCISVTLRWQSNGAFRESGLKYAWKDSQKSISPLDSVQRHLSVFQKLALLNITCREHFWFCFIHFDFFENWLFCWGGFLKSFTLNIFARTNDNWLILVRFWFPWRFWNLSWMLNQICTSLIKSIAIEDSSMMSLPNAFV